MSALALIERLQARGVKLRLADGRIHYEAPEGALSPEDVDELQAFKPEVAAALVSMESAACAVTGSNVSAPAGAHSITRTATTCLPRLAFVFVCLISLNSRSAV